MEIKAARNHTIFTAFRRIAAVLCLIAGTAVLVLSVQMQWTVNSAVHCIRSVQSLTPGKSTLAEARADLNYAAARREERCFAQVCSISFSFESWLSRIAFGKRRGLHGYVLAKDGIVTNIQFSYHEDGSVGVALNENAARSSRNMLGFLVAARDLNGGAGTLKIKLPATAPADSRRALMDLNLGCMSHFTGCGNVGEVIPDLQSLRFSNET